MLDGDLYHLHRPKIQLDLLVSLRFIWIVLHGKGLEDCALFLRIRNRVRVAENDHALHIRRPVKILDLRLAVNRKADL